jgi:hypothetical protein
VDDQSGGKFPGTRTGNRGQAPATADIPKVPTSPPIGARTDAINPPPRVNSTDGTRKRFRLPGAELVAEIWFAWRASRELLGLYKRIHREEPQLIGSRLYERIVTRRSGLDVNAAVGVLRHAEQSFCEWPSERDLKFRDLVLYIVIEEYMRSHVAIGTYTHLEKVVARVIPQDL